MLGLEPYSEMDKRKRRANDRDAMIEHKKAYARLLFGSLDNSPIGHYMIRQARTRDTMLVKSRGDR